MNAVRNFAAAVCAFALIWFLPGSRAISGAQTTFATGQNVQPVFEGWEKNPDGTFTFVFGYLSRNYVDEQEIPIGANNSFSPGPADRGQPTHFYPRRQTFVFKVQVPANWGAKTDLVWTVTLNGHTAKAVGHLLPVWELDEGTWVANRVGDIYLRKLGDSAARLRPPSVHPVGDGKLTVNSPENVVLTVAARDEGGPGPQRGRGGAGRGSDVPSATGVWVERTTGPTTQDMVKWRVAQQSGLAVSWLHYRGPGKVTFEPQAVSVKPEGGEARTTARFSGPGTYVIRAVADNGVYTTPVDLTVVVTGSGSSAARQPR